jgi:hypothetical protein
MSVKELKAAVIAVLGEAAFRAKNFVEKSEFVNFLLEQEEIKRRQQTGVHCVPAGKYIIGDPCFLVTDVLHLETFNETYYDSEEEEEDTNARQTKNSHKSKSKKQNDAAVAEEIREQAKFTDATPVIAFNSFDTDAGPSWYSDKDNKYSFLINGGVIALVPFSYNPHFAVQDGVAHIVEFSSPAACKESRGVIYFGDIEINTRRPAKAKAQSTRGGGSGGGGGKKGKMDRYEDVDEDADEEVVEEEEEDEEDEEEFDDNSSEDSEDDYVPEKKKKKRKVYDSDSSSGDRKKKKKKSHKEKKRRADDSDSSGGEEKKKKRRRVVESDSSGGEAEFEE